ncbi:MAG: magnesium-translocating P-type ATPase [Chloroflexi bacterium]|nr:magnesium-translocating P-type ATPase [Chloroflexota bacterium]MCL5109415.1 magnesium-translocating P-type ATPase [Chloroflexota bacterium]
MSENRRAEGPTGAFWSYPAGNLFEQIGASPQGLSGREAGQRLVRYGPNLLKPRRKTATLALLLSQFSSPIVLILIFAAGLAFYVEDHTDTIIILAIVIASGLLGFWQERGAASAVDKLLAMVHIRVTALRDGTAAEIPVEELVPGDVVLLSAGRGVPGDCLILESQDLFADEATLTGETYPVEKTPGVLPSETALAQRTNALFAGTHVVSGTATVLVVRTGAGTEFGKISERLRLGPPETEFERGVRRFGYLLAEVTGVLVLVVFAINVFLARPVLDSFLFSLALAVGLTPQLLPAIISINLAHGAKRMAAAKVIVKRLAAIENFGSMNVLCSDKTGTLTEGMVHLHSALDVAGQESEKVLFYAYLNAAYEKGFANPIDEAIRSYRQIDLSAYQKLDEIPYDFLRKRLSILVAIEGRRRLISKGAVDNVLAVCSVAETADGQRVGLGTVQAQLRARFQELGAQGFRTLGVAYRDLEGETPITRSDEVEMTFLGFLVLADPPKAEIAATVKLLNDLGISLKIITGDNRVVAASVGTQLRLERPRVLTGPELHQMSDAALQQRAGGTDIFAEVEPNQKERIILALKKAGHVVGYLGDGINDAPALHAADVGISVDNAADVAKEAADFVLLEKDLGVLVQGVREGRATFANTLKYVFMATSANFGNMFSMAGASLLLPFLPLLPKQILLTNLLTDFPEMTIATDNVDVEMVQGPRRWDIRFIRNFMMTFGLVSSVFDYLTFGVLLFLARASTAQFRTGWFVESVVSASLIVLVIRTRRPPFRSRPSRQLLVATLLVVGATVALPYSPIAGYLGFEPLPASVLALIAVVVVLYIATAEAAKRYFYR